jgi:hypothetical protein
MWFHPLLNHGFWGDYCSLCQGFTYWNRASLQPVAWFWLTPGVCARGYLWHPVTLTPAASSTLASWAADRPWRLCMLRGWTLGEGNINFIKYIWHIYDGHMSDVCVYIYISVCVCVCGMGVSTLLYISFVEHFETHMAHMINAFHCWGDPIPCWHLFLWPFPWPSTFWSWCNLGGRPGGILAVGPNEFDGLVRLELFYDYDYKHLQSTKLQYMM